MKINVKLFASFQAGRFEIEEREYPVGTTVAQVAADIDLNEEELGIMLVNSRHVRLDHVLADGCTLAFFPLLGGG